MDFTAARVRALELALNNARDVKSLDDIIRNADKFAKFIISGTVPAKDEKPAVMNVFNVTAVAGDDPVEVAKRVNARSI